MTAPIAFVGTVTLPRPLTKEDITQSVAASNRSRAAALQAMQRELISMLEGTLTTDSDALLNLFRGLNAHSTQLQELSGNPHFLSEVVERLANHCFEHEDDKRRYVGAIPLIVRANLSLDAALALLKLSSAAALACARDEQASGRETGFNMVRACIGTLHQRSPEIADQAELDFMKKASDYLPQRHTNWYSKGSYNCTVPYTREFVARAREVASEAQRQALVLRAPLDFLSTAEINEAILGLPGSAPSEGNVRRFAEFPGAHPEHRMALAKVFVAHGWDAIKHMPWFDGFARNLGAIRPLFDSDPFSEFVPDRAGDSAGGYSRAVARVSVLRAIAETHSSDNAHKLLNAVATAAMTAVKTSDKVSRFEFFIGVIGTLAGTQGPRADIKHLQDCIRGADLGAARNLPVSPSLVAFAKDAQPRLETVFSVMKTDSALLLEAMVDSGFVKLNELAVKNLTADIIGPALARNPARIAEITDLKHFVATAKRFKIQVSLPPEAEAALAAEASMKSQMSGMASAGAVAAVDPLAGVDAPARKTTRRRAP
jgi:hypothetical protein